MKNNPLECKFIITKEDCWEWIRSRNENGYGHLTYQKKSWKAHRLSYFIYKGDIPKGLDLDHKCRNRACINPDHLEIVTRRENILRGVGIPAQCVKKTHCINGHLLSEENIYLRKEPSGFYSRNCKKCRYIRRKESYQKLKGGF